MKDKEKIINRKSCGEMILYNDDVIKEWKKTYEEYGPLLKPNRKSINEILEYIKFKYPVIEYTSYKARKVVEKNMLNNYGKRLTENHDTLDIVVLRVKNEDNAVRLYENQAIEHIEFMDKMKKTIINFKPYPFIPIPTIIIGAERKSGYILVEGSQEISEDITMIQGLDSDELKNYYLVANYIETLKKYSKLCDVIK